MKRWTVLVALGWLALPAPAADTGALKQFGREIADTVERVMPSVVVVRTEAVQYHIARDPFWGRWYRIPERLAGQGSGVIIRPAGYVLTSNHVVAEAQQVEVALPDGTQFPAQIVGRDETTDLAVLKIEKAGGRVFAAIEAGDSDKVRIGEFAIAIGSPFTLNSSVTLGIVSQKGRSVGLLPFEDFIQTDASINPGNSGGPLVDVAGRLIGINAVIQTASPAAQGNIGIGFAVPVNLAMRVARQLLDRGRVERPWLGIHMRAVAEAEARAPSRAERGRTPGAAKAGVLIVETAADGPAQRAGARAGDVIIAVDGHAVASPHDVQKLVWARDVGAALRVDVLRAGNKKTVIIPTAPPPE